MSLATRIAQEFNTVRGEIAESDSTAVKLTGSQTIEGVKTFTSSVQGNLVGNSATATKLATPRKITISGDVSGNTSFDGSTDVTLSTQVADDSHNHSTTTITGLGTAATANLTTSSTDITAGRVLKVGDFSIGRVGEAAPLPVSDLNDLNMNGVFNVTGGTPNWVYGSVGGVVQQFVHGSDQYITQIAYSSTADRILTRTKQNTTTWSSWIEIIHTGNISQTTGTSTEFPMSQKATTDAINTKVGLTGNETIAGVKTFTSNIVGNVTGNITGNSATATKLATARTINGVNFDGSANITVYDSTKAPLNSPALTGIPKAPTATVATNNTQIATTAFVKSVVNSSSTLGFTQSLGTNGWTKLPNGLILQWGKVYGTGAATINFPIAFPSAACGIVGSPDLNIGFGIKILSRSQGEISRVTNENYPLNIYYIVIGY